ncbi:MAG: trigger factor, partial [Pirellulales bacterium]|nr:trigger factor [Pirellulales bacterium]
MADDDLQDDLGEDTATAVEEQGAEPQRLDLDVDIDKAGACQRHVTVTVSRADIERYFDDEFSDLVTKAEVPGFRAGRAPRKLVESRFRKEVGDSIKGKILMDSLGQISEEEKLSAISEPDIDLESVEVPDDGPMTFEFDLEVRPEFDIPDWKGLAVERPVHEFTDADVDTQIKKILGRYGKMAPTKGAVEADDFVICDLEFVHDGKTLKKSKEHAIRVLPTLSFQDGNIEGFDKLVIGKKIGDEVEATVTLSDDAPNESLRGEEVTVKFDIVDGKRMELPELTSEFLDTLGEGFKDETQLRDYVKESLERQLDYQHQQRAREQITELLTESADWELPPEMLKRQSQRELDRAIMELRRSGFSEADIRMHENELRQNSSTRTAQSLKEHFILERIAEDESIEDKPQDYEMEIALIASQTGESPRRVRAQI